MKLYFYAGRWQETLRELKDGIYTGERAMFQAKDTDFERCIFEDGESPLKHSRNITLEGTSFRWKYPLWYSENIKVSGCTFFEMARAGIWYTNDIELNDVTYIAPKGFRRCSNVKLENVVFKDAKETLWDCENITMKNVSANGDYLAMNSRNIDIDRLELTGNYCFDGARDIKIKNSRLISKDAFWNCENVTAENCYICGEYLGWNSRSLTFVNCTIESLQGLCFIDDLKMIGCVLQNTTLAFEYSTVNADICGNIDSVKNPSGGVIRARSIGEIIMESDKVDVSKTKIFTDM